GDLAGPAEFRVIRIVRGALGNIQRFVDEAAVQLHHHRLRVSVADVGVGVMDEEDFLDHRKLELGAWGFKAGTRPKARGHPRGRGDPSFFARQAPRPGDGFPRPAGMTPWWGEVKARDIPVFDQNSARAMAIGVPMARFCEGPVNTPSLIGKTVSR